MKIKLSDVEINQNTSEIPVLKTMDTKYGFRHLAVTKEHLQQCVDNFNLNASGQLDSKGLPQVPFNFKHDIGGTAAGWIKELSVKGEELLAVVEWTENGVKAIKSKQYSYVSPELRLSNYVQTETNKAFSGAVITGVALVNSPFISSLPALQLSKDKVFELFNNFLNKEVIKMSVEDVIAQLTPLIEGLTDDEKKMLKAKLMELLPTDEVVAPEALPAEVAASLSKENKVSEGEIKMSAELADVQQKLILMEKEKEFEGLVMFNKAVPAQKDAFMKGDLIEFAKKGQEALKMTESGSSENEGSISSDKAHDDLEQQIVKMQKEKNLHFDDARQAVWAMEKNAQALEILGIN